jgi:hypothetical protein
MVAATGKIEAVAEQPTAGRDGVVERYRGRKKRYLYPGDGADIRR